MSFGLAVLGAVVAGRVVLVGSVVDVGGVVLVEVGVVVLGGVERRRGRAGLVAAPWSSAAS